MSIVTGYRLAQAAIAALTKVERELPPETSDLRKQKEDPPNLGPINRHERRKQRALERRKARN